VGICGAKDNWTMARFVVTPERVEMAKKADHIFISMIREAGLYDKIGQAFAALDPSKAVGVMGDKRTYENVVLLRVVETTDFMTANPYPFEHGFLTSVSTRIINEVHGVCWVAYDYTSKPPGTIEFLRGILPILGAYPHSLPVHTLS